ncbi:MAG: hypothetical protein WD511_00060 [Balneolaceae bacterium]
MKTIVTALIGLIFLQSCDVFKSKDELLTQEKWVLHNRFISNYDSGESTREMIFYRKSDQVLTLKFNSDGTVRITEDNGEKYATIRWYWKNDDKKYITLDRGKYIGDFHILDLSSKQFQWSKSDIYSTETTLETFKNLDDPEWDDDKVEHLNSLR